MFLKRVMSFVLCLVMLLSMVPVTHAQTQDPPRAAVDTGDVTVAGTNSLGHLLSQDLLAQKQSDEAAGGYNVVGLTIENGVATAEFRTLEPAILVVAIYEEDSLQLACTGKIEVRPEDTEVSIVLEDYVPWYFVASAYLVDIYDYSPLCASYTTSIYTMEMQELLNSTADDYPQDRVLTLADTRDTNFLVCEESVIMLEHQESINIVTSIDDKNAMYVIENADANITSLTAGDIFVLPYENNGLLIVKVATLTLNGTTATITGDELQLEDVFQYAKLEQEATTQDVDIDDTTSSEGVSYEGLVKEDSSQETRASGTVSEKYSLKYQFMNVPIYDTSSDDDEDADEVKLCINGDVGVSLGVEFSCYISLKEYEIKFKADLAFEGTFGVTGKINDAVVELGKCSVLLYGISCDFTPTVHASATGAITFKYEFSNTVGGIYNSTTGFTNLCSGPSSDFGFQLDGKVFIGVDTGPSVRALGIFKLELSALAGIEFSAKTNDLFQEKDSDILHHCTSCIEADANLKLVVNTKLKILEKEVFSRSLTIKPLKLFSYYWSINDDGIKKGSCPNKSYRVTFCATDSNDQNVPGVEVYANMSGHNEILIGTTDSTGTVVGYLPKGTATIRAICNEKNYYDTIKVSDPCKVFVRTYLQESSFYEVDPNSVLDEGVLLKGEIANLTWILSHDGVLTVSGTGYMTNWSNYTKVPWYYHRSKIKSVVIKPGVKRISNYAFWCCTELTSVTIPDTVLEVGIRAFEGCQQLTSVSIPSSVTSIGEYAFFNCSALSSVALSNGIVSIGKSVFSHCSSLASIAIPDSTSSIGNSAFSDCAMLSSVHLGNGVKTIGEFTFANCASLESIVIPNSVSNLGDYTFQACTGLTDVTLGSGITKIRYGTFDRCSAMTGIIIPNSVKEISTLAFSGCTNLLNIQIPESVTNIGGHAFDDTAWFNSFPDGIVYANKIACGYKGRCSGELEIAEGTVAIGECAFENHSEINTVIIPQSVTFIDNFAFGNCWYLTRIVFEGHPPKCGLTPFDSSAITAYYPVGDSTWSTDAMHDFSYYWTWVSYDPAVGVPVSKKPETRAVFGGEYDTDLSGNNILKLASFSDLVPGAEYLLLAVIDLKAEDLLAADNLLYIDQAQAKNDGTLSFQYIQRVKTNVSYVMICGASNKNLEDAKITFPAMTESKTARAVNPVVRYDGKLLREGRDYTVSGDVYYTKPGTYTCYVRGIYSYAGFVECTYTVEIEQVEEPEIEKFNIDVARMLLGNSLEFQFGVDKTKIPDKTGYYAKIEKIGADGVTKTFEIPASQWGTAGQYHAISYSGLRATEMADTFYVTVYNAQGQAVSNAKQDSVRDYVDRSGSGQTNKGRTMLADMLNYGAAAQLRFGYGTEDLANSRLTDAQKAYATKGIPEMSNELIKGKNYQATRFLLESSIQVQLAFKGLKTDMYAIYEYTDFKGEAQSVRVEGADFVMIGGAPAGVELSKLVYADARSMVHVTVYNADGTVHGEATESMESCATRGNADVFIELMKFADSAKAYLNA